MKKLNLKKTNISKSLFLFDWQPHFTFYKLDEIHSVSYESTFAGHEPRIWWKT